MQVVTATGLLRIVKDIKARNFAVAIHSISKAYCRDCPVTQLSGISVEPTWFAVQGSHVSEACSLQ